MSRTEPRPRPGRAGFTLIEALVAFAVLAMVLAVALPLLAGGLRSVDAADRRLAALAVAESRLADAIATTPTSFGVAEGTDVTELRWRLNVDPVAANAAGAARLARYEVTVAAPGDSFESGVRLVTYRLLMPEAP